MAKAKIYTYKGFTGTLTEIIDHFELDISYSGLYSRLYKDMSIEEAIEIPLRDDTYTYKDFTGTLQEVIDHFKLDISKYSLQRRLNKGMTIKEAIKKPARKLKIKQFYTYKGFTGSISKIIDHFKLDISHDALCNRLRKGVPIEEAIEKPLANNKAKIYTCEGFTGTLQDVIDHFKLDISYNALQSRLQRGMTIKEAIETPLDKSKAAKIYTYKNFTGSIQKIINHFELDISNEGLRKRIRKGMFIEEAIEYSFTNEYLNNLKQLSIDENIPFIDIYNLIDGVPYKIDKIKKMI